MLQISATQRKSFQISYKHYHHPSHVVYQYRVSRLQLAFDAAPPATSSATRLNEQNPTRHSHTYIEERRRSKWPNLSPALQLRPKALLPLGLVRWWIEGVVSGSEWIGLLVRLRQRIQWLSSRGRCRKHRFDTLLVISSHVTHSSDKNCRHT